METVQVEVSNLSGSQLCIKNFSVDSGQTTRVTRKQGDLGIPGLIQAPQFRFHCETELWVFEVLCLCGSLVAFRGGEGLLSAQGCRRTAMVSRDCVEFEV